MTDQQRFDAIKLVQDELSRYEGKLKVRTPNIDRIFREGAYFKNAYCHCPVCGPARGVLRTGCTLERTGMQTNKVERTEVYELMNLYKNKITTATTIDQVLSEQLGYEVEYYGKWHLPEIYYFQKNGRTPAVMHNDYEMETGKFTLTTGEDWALKFRRYLNYDESKGNIEKKYKNGDQMDTYSRYPYTPIQLDARYGLPTQTPIDASDQFPQLAKRKSQPNVLGPFSLGKEYTAIAYNGKIAVKALDRLAKQDKPFALTVSFHNPHAPMTPTKEHLQYYWQNRQNIFVTPNLDDDMVNSAYSNLKYVEMGYTEEAKLQEWIACYYAMIEEIDGYVGQMLDKLEDYKIKQNTVVVFTSDHGEMLGSHGMREKNNFYEESVRIPLAISFPGVIPDRTIVDTQVSQLDLYATILDYLGHGAFDNSDGVSMRRFIERTSVNADHDERYVVSEWDFRQPISQNKLDRSLGSETNFMVVKGGYKLMMTKLARASRMDMMYNFHNDPYEVNNLIGTNGLIASDEVIGKAEHLKCLLVDWMERMDGPGYYSKSFFTDSTIGPFSDGITSSEGDIKEISSRRQWRTVDFWKSDTELEFAKPVWKGNEFIQNEYLYFGKTTFGVLVVDDVAIKGPDANFFTIEASPGIILSGRCTRLKVSYASNLQRNEVDAYVELTHGGGRNVEIIPLKMDTTESTHSPTFSLAPSPFPTITTSPTIEQTGSQAPSSFLSLNSSSLLRFLFMLFGFCLN